MTTDAEDELDEAKNATYDRFVALDRPELSLSQMAQYSLDHPDERREDQIIEAYTKPKDWKQKVRDRMIRRSPCLEIDASANGIVGADVPQVEFPSWNGTHENETMRLKPRAIDESLQESVDFGYECANARPTFGDMVAGIRLGMFQISFTASRSQ
jgi:hypothetical protein